MVKNNIFFELLFEDIPYDEIKVGFNFFKKNITEQISNNHLKFKTIDFFFTRNRFILDIKNIDNKSPDKEIEIAGPPKDICYKNNEPTPALIGFCKKNNIPIEQIYFKEKKGKTYVFAKKIILGAYSKDIVSKILTDTILSLPFKKTMDLDNRQHFIRPIRRILFFVDDKIESLKIFNIESSNITYTDHFLQKHTIISINEYYKIISENGIILSHEKRIEYIQNYLNESQKNGLSFKINLERLDSLAYLSEKPQVFVGNFDEKFLSLPEEIIDTTLWKHQKSILILENSKPINKYFSICDSGKDINKIIIDYNKVALSRFDDANFFYNNDLNTSIEQFIEKQKSALYFENWGTYQKFIEYATYIGKKLVNLLGLEEEKIKKIIYYSKFDLFTNIVSEKTYAHLQGIMGYYYLLKQGIDEDIALAVKEQYLPLYENDILPETVYGAVLSIINRVILLSVVFSLHLKVSGSKDIYGVRRAASGLYKIITQFNFDFDLLELFNRIDYLSDIEKNALFDFILERIKAYEKENISSDIINAALYIKDGNLLHLKRKIYSLDEFAKSSEFEQTKNTLKRVLNILDKSETFTQLNVNLFKKPEEKNLYQAFVNFQKNIQNNTDDYHYIFEEILRLKPFIDNFFDNVLVNVEDKTIQNNRKALLSLIGKEILKIANFKEIS